MKQLKVSKTTILLVIHYKVHHKKSNKIYKRLMERMIDAMSFKLRNVHLMAHEGLTFPDMRWMNCFDRTDFV